MNVKLVHLIGGGWQLRIRSLWITCYGRRNITIWWGKRLLLRRPPPDL